MARWADTGELVFSVPEMDRRMAQAHKELAERSYPAAVLAGISGARELPQLDGKYYIPLPNPPLVLSLAAAFEQATAIRYGDRGITKAEFKTAVDVYVNDVAQQAFGKPNQTFCLVGFTGDLNGNELNDAFKEKKWSINGFLVKRC